MDSQVARTAVPRTLGMVKLEFDQMKGMALSMGKMMLSNRMDEEFKIISSNYKHLGEELRFGNVLVVSV